jgi:uncharacterized protein YndB with AHSA1/START domain
MPDIVHLIWIHVLPERVYQALTTAEGIRQWWTRDATLDSTPGGRGEFVFNEGRFVAKVEVDHMEPPVRVSWRVVSGGPGWGAAIAFDLRAEGSDTVLSFVHRGFGQADERCAAATTRWGAYLVSLKQYLETGTGAPHPDDVFAATRPSHSQRLAAVAITGGDTVLATADVARPPERVIRALTTDEVERWWGSADTYRMAGWTADVRVGGRWSVAPRTADGRTLPAGGVFLEIDAPRRVVQTRRYEWDHPRLGRRETTVTYRLDPTTTGTRVTVRHDGFAGRSDAADEHAKGWERVLGWLAAYLRSDGAPTGAGS